MLFAAMDFLRQLIGRRGYQFENNQLSGSTLYLPIFGDG